MAENKLKTAERMGNFELLRIIAMVMIVTLHYLGKGGLIYLENDSVTYYVAWMLEALSYVAVNIYVMISGYFTVSAKYKLNKLIDLWLQTVVITVLAYFASLKLGIIEKISVRDIIDLATPVTSKAYWFITIYFIFCAIAPLLVNVVNLINQKQHKIVCAVLVFLTSFLPSVFFLSDWLKISMGYHIMWFITLFFVASYIRKYDTFNKKPLVYFAYYLLATFLGYIAKFTIRYISQKVSGEDISNDFFAKYNLIFVFLASVFLFLAFKNIKISGNIINKIILFFSSTTLYVYLLHEAPRTGKYLWETVVNPKGHLGMPDIVINYIVGIGGVYLICSLLGTLIKTLYRFSQLPKLTKLIDKKITSLTKRFMKSKFISRH